MPTESHRISKPEDAKNHVDEAPIVESQRIASLDVLRGFALLGILLMNIQSFSMPQAAYLNPSAWGDLSGFNGFIWILLHTLADQKFMTLFSLLFGAGIALMTDRLKKRENMPLPIHYWRTFLLLLIGLTHAYFLWFGDILVTYALCGFVVVLFRHLKPQFLVVIGCCCLTIATLISLFLGLSLPYWPQPELDAQRLEWSPTAEAIESEIEIYQGGWWQQMQHRAPVALYMHSILFLFWGGWRAGGLMLIGMALFKWGVVTGKLSASFYRRLILGGLLFGLPLIALGISSNFSAGWTLEYSMFFGSQWNYWGSLGVAMAYLGLVMLACQSGFWPWLQARLAAVGRMALTNYLLHSVICGLIFYGHGLALIGQLERTPQVLIVFMIWTLQIFLSTWWLNRYHFGPAEWLWRSLTYRRWQPLAR